MNEFKFIKYEATPKEKHLGIATVLVRGIILRYKVVKTKDGNSIFAAAASYKMSGDDPETRYVGAFALDSNSEQELMLDFVKEKISEILSKNHQKSNTSNDRRLNDKTYTSQSNSSYSRSNEELDVSDDLPF